MSQQRQQQGKGPQNQQRNTKPKGPPRNQRNWDKPKPEEAKKAPPPPPKQQASETMRVDRQGKDGDFLLTIHVFDKNGSPKSGVTVRVKDLDSPSFTDLKKTGADGVTTYAIKFDCKKKRLEIVSLGTAILPQPKTLWNHNCFEEVVSRNEVGDLVQIRTEKTLTKITETTYRSKS